jgi:hypothetical protein
VGVNQNSTIVFPLPIDVIRPFLEPAEGTSDASPARERRPGWPAGVGAAGDPGELPGGASTLQLETPFVATSEPHPSG